MPIPYEIAPHRLVSRRGLLKAGVAVAGGLALGPDFWRRAYAQQGLRTGDSPYGALQAPDANGLMLPPGFTSRVVARSSQPVPGTTYAWHQFPDGGHCFPTEDGGWVYCSNSENPPPADRPVFSEQALGGVSSIRFDAEGEVVDAYRVLEGTRSNCAGGPTPWGTWLSGEEYDLGPGDAGHVWEVDPLLPATEQTPKRHDAMGILKHEMAAVDPARRQVYLTEDMELEEGHDTKTGGLFYRYTPSAWPDLSAGLLEAMAVAADGTVTWHEVPDPLATELEVRRQLPDATPFDGGEGVWYDSDHVYFTTKGDERVWELDVTAQRLRVLYDAASFESPVLRGVDNLIVSSFTGDILVAEDGDNMEVVMITPDGLVAPLARATGPEHGFVNPISSDGPVPVAEALGPFSVLGDVPTKSEITGLAFSPDGSRLYFNSQRGGFTPETGPGPGITYEVAGPFVTARPPSPEPSPSPAPPPPPAPDDRDLPATGGAGLAFGVGAAAVAAALRLRGRGAGGR